MFFKIRNKIIILFILLITASIVIVGTILFGKTREIIEYQTSVSIINNLHNASNNINGDLKSIDNMDASIILDEDIIRCIESSPEFGSYGQYETSRSIIKKIDTLMYTDSAIHSIYIYSKASDYLYKSRMNRTLTGKEFENSMWFEAMASWPRKQWKCVKGLDTDRGRNLILSIKPVKNTDMTKTIGYFSINIDELTIRQQLDNIKIGKTGYIYVLDSAQTILSHHDKGLIGKNAGMDPGIETTPGKQGYFVDEALDKKLLVLYYVSEYTGWAYIAKVPLNELMGPINEAGKITVVTCLLAILLAVVLSFAISGGIFHPVRKLVEFMRKAGEGQTNLMIAEKRKDEFGILYHSFNKMIEKIKTLIDEVYVQKLIKKEMQLKMIQSQLDPHFLYNTLDAIHWAARERAFDEVCDMTFELSNYFRKNLSEGKDLVTVSEAIELTKSYISLQCIRFENRFHFDIQADASILDCIVLKYIFQPIVENAIYHGIEKANQHGRIEISWKEFDHHLMEFVVKDNGTGIEAAKLKEIKEAINNDDIAASGNFALKNINQQIKLFYGQEYGIDIESFPGEGTKVRAVFPKMHHAN